MEIIRYLLWLRLYRARRIMEFFQKMEKDIRINYLFTRIVKLITVELYCTHTAACIFYYLATTVPPAQEGYTWIGSLSLGDYKYINFREIDFIRRYITSLYFSIVTMATVGKNKLIPLILHISIQQQQQINYKLNLQVMVIYMQSIRERWCSS
jgi:potassium channel